MNIQQNNTVRHPNVRNAHDYNRYQQLQSNPTFNNPELQCFNTQQFYTKVRPTFVQEEFNPNQLLDNTFANARTQPKTLSKETIEYEYIREFVFINSGDRDRSKYPSPSNFKIELPTCYNDIIQISIASGNVPNLDGVDVNHYVYLDVPELNHIKTTSMDTYFGILTLNAGISSTFFILDKSATNLMPHIMTPIRQTLDTLHIKLLHQTKVQINLGTQTELEVLDEAKQTSFVFEVLVRRKRRKGLDEDYRNVAGIHY
jgi:hypothetical protein